MFVLLFFLACLGTSFHLDNSITYFHLFANTIEPSPCLLWFINGFHKFTLFAINTYFFKCQLTISPSSTSIPLSENAFRIELPDLLPSLKKQAKILTSNPHTQFALSNPRLQPFTDYSSRPVSIEQF